MPWPSLEACSEVVIWPRSSASCSAWARMRTARRSPRLAGSVATKLTNASFPTSWTSADRHRLLELADAVGVELVGGEGRDRVADRAGREVVGGVVDHADLVERDADHLPVRASLHARELRRHEDGRAVEHEPSASERLRILRAGRVDPHAPLRLAVVEALDLVDVLRDAVLARDGGVDQRRVGRGHAAGDEGVVLQHLCVGSVQPEQALEGGERAPGRLGEISIAHDDRAY